MGEQVTIRRSRKVSTSPETVAAALPAAAVASFQTTTDYRAYFQALTEEVEDLTGQFDTGLTMRVAEVLGVTPSDWFQRKTNR